MEFRLEDYMGCAASVARTFHWTHRPPVDVDDVISEAYVALCKAFRSWRPEFKCSRKSWIRTKIQYHLLDWLRDQSWAPRLEVERAKRGLVQLKAFQNGELFDRGETDSGMASVDAGDSFERMLRGMTAKERLVFRRYYVDGITMKEIGFEIGLSESRVSQMHAKGIARLEEKLRTMAN